MEGLRTIDYLCDEEGDCESLGHSGILKAALDEVCLFTLRVSETWLTITRWSRVFVDDVSIALNAGGKAYSAYGIDRGAGAIVVVRPDGYVGIVAPVEDVGVLNTYFAGFMVQRATPSSHL